VLLPDVNILVYAFQPDAQDNRRYREWLDSLVNGAAPYGMSDLVCSGFLRIATHPALYNPPNSVADALAFIEGVRGGPGCVIISPGPRHWALFRELCLSVRARGNLVPDAYFAALAIESGSEWITTDRDYARFPGLRWRHPLD
jgi:toxin-antitoxin system PIN domain toxin